MGLNPRKSKWPIPASYFKKLPRRAWIIFPPSLKVGGSSSVFATALLDDSPSVPLLGIKAYGLFFSAYGTMYIQDFLFSKCVGSGFVLISPDLIMWVYLRSKD